MSTCPKCGYHTISGPRFTRVPYGREVLRYTCCRCGYEHDTPPLDSPARALSATKGTDSSGG